MTLIPKLFRAVRGLTAREGIARGFYQPRVRRRAALALVDASGRFLEIGCGREFFLELEEVALTAPKLETVGIDNATDQLRSFTRTYLDNHGGTAAHLVGARAEALPFPDGTFEVASCLNTLYNLPSIDVVRIFLLEMARVLKPGGRCLIDIRNRWNLPTVLRFKLLRWHDPTIAHPLRVYSAAELEGAAA